VEHDARLATSVPLPDMLTSDPTVVPLKQPEQDRLDVGVNDEVSASVDMPGDLDEVTLAEDALPSPIPELIRRRSVPRWMKDFVFKISVHSALRDRESEARPAITAELQQKVDMASHQDVDSEYATAQGDHQVLYVSQR
jgi:hypothetical protein